jgi:hypothetical protein
LVKEIELKESSLPSVIHTVEQGEYLARIAMDYGFSDWKTIYNHPQNAEFKSNRPNPNVILPGDQLFIPDKTEKQESASTDQSHCFQIKNPRLCLKIVLKDAEEKPLSNQPYALIVDRRSLRGTTDGNGMLQQEIPIKSHGGELRLPSLGILWQFHLGHLDPVDTKQPEAAIRGAQARLNNLGFHCGPVDGVFGPRTKSAVAMFQEIELNRKNPDGQLDDATKQALRSQHGC